MLTECYLKSSKCCLTVERFIRIYNTEYLPKNLKAFAHTGSQKLYLFIRREMMDTRNEFLSYL